MIMKNGKQIGFIYKNGKKIDKIIRHGKIYFEQGFVREKTSTTLPISFDGVSKDLKNYKIYGSTYQNSTKGNQLIDFINYTTKSNPITTFSFENDILVLSQTQQGTFIRVNYDVTQLIKTNQNKTLKFYYKNMDTTHFDSANATIVQLVIDKSGTRTYKTLLNSSGDTTQYEIPSNTDDITEAYINIYTNNSSTSTSASSITITEPLLYFDENSDYEPYTGKRPSPNPDYPQEIISCGNKTRNLFDLSKVSRYTSTSGIQVSVEKDNIKINGTNQSSSAVGVYLNAVGITYSLKANKTYVAKYITGESASASTYRLDIRNASNTSQILAYESGKNGLSYTPTENINIRFYIRVPANGTVNLTGKIIFEESDTLHDYEPYGYKIPVNVRSDNLFDKNNSNDLLNNVSINNTTSVISNANGFYTLRKDCKPNTTYTISKVVSSRFIVAYSNNLTYTSGETLLGKVSDNSATNLTITTGENAKSLYVFYSKLSDETTYTLQQILDSIMIVEGSTAPSKYIPYYNATTNIYLDEPLRKIDEYSDYIDFKNNKIIRNIDEIVLDGSES